IVASRARGKKLRRGGGDPNGFLISSFHAKTPHATNLTYANKKLHKLFPMSVHSLLAKRDYQCKSPFHMGFRNAPNRR
ncbi:hypothetical protein, partial [Collinsella aerofaciens]|uniref:hypothetical protein n=1 Tax=Collinsella aerofaciens TaxID=74426 RepID=UPI001E52F704